MIRVQWRDVVGRPQQWGGEVTNVAPLEVTPDGSSVAVTPTWCLVGGLLVGDRVLMQSAGTSVTVLGKNYTY